MEAGGFESLREVSVVHVSRRVDSEPDSHHQSTASPMASQRGKHADKLQAVASHEAPAVERTPMFGSMFLKELGKRVGHTIDYGGCLNAEPPIRNQRPGMPDTNSASRHIPRTRFRTPDWKHFGPFAQNRRLNH
jgi:hypothetical protein